MADEHRVRVEQGVVFAVRDGRELRCDIYRPPGEPAPGPGVLLLHGGSWRSGERSQLHGYGILLARAGLVCVTADYRLADQAPWPAQLEDVRAAIRWMRSSASRLGIDPDRLVAHGNSAGGHLALLAAGTAGGPADAATAGQPDVPTRLAAVVAVYPPVKLHRAPTDLFSPPPGDEAAAAAEREVGRQASPLTHVSADFPPTLLIHGDADEVVPVEASLRMHAALREAGVPVELHLYPEQPHAFDADPAFGRRCAEAIAFFLERYAGGGDHPD